MPHRVAKRSPLRALSLGLFAALLVTAGCRKGSNDPVIRARETAPEIPCALAGATNFQRECTAERTVSPDGMAIVLHHPDGGFRRLLVATDGRGVVTADGADQAMVTVIDANTIEVAVGDDRYRLPATVKGEDLQQK